MSADYQATEKLRINGAIAYNLADDSWDWNFSERARVYREDNDEILLSESEVGSPGGKAAINYDTWDQNNNIVEYSDLSYEQYSLTLGGTYNFTDAFYTTVEATYDIFESDEEYVYGDEDGDMMTGYVAIGYKF